MRNPVEDTFLSVRICVLPKVAWWGKGKVDTLDGNSIDSTASDYNGRKACIAVYECVQKSPLYTHYIK